MNTCNAFVLKLKDFIDCLVNNNLDVFSKYGVDVDNHQETYNQIYAEYVELSGVKNTEEFEQLKIVYNLQTRIQRIELLLKVQFESVYHFNKPCVAGFKLLKFYGHHLQYDESKFDKYAFEKQLKDIELKEKKYQVALEENLKKLHHLQMQSSSQFKKPTLEDIYKNIVALQKENYVIDVNKTSVGEYALAIKDNTDRYEKQLQQLNKLTNGG